MFVDYSDDSKCIDPFYSNTYITHDNQTNQLRNEIYFF